MLGHAQKLILAGTMLATAIGAGAALAADEPANLIKYRQATMKAIGGHMGALGAMAKGEVSFTDEAAVHAGAINAMSQNILRLFPEGSGEKAGETRALPAIWEKWSEFETATQALQDESAKLVEIAGSGDSAAIAAQIGALGKNGCGTCHKPFRKEQN